MTPGRLFEEGRWGLLLLFLLVLPCLLGTFSGIAAVLVAMAFLPALLRPGAVATAYRQPAVVIFAGAFVVLFAVFAINARQPGDLIYVFNFLSLPMAAGVYVVARERAGEGAALAVCACCVAGAGVAVLVGVYDVNVAGRARAEGLFSNANPFARIALLLGFFALAGIVVGRHPARWLLLLGPAFGIAAALLAASRGAILALPAMVLLFAVVLLVAAHRRRVAMLSLAVAALLAAAAAIVLGVVFDLAAPERIADIGAVVREVLSDGASTDGATVRRLGLYGGGLAAFEAAPLLGHGWAAAIDVVVALSGNDDLARFRSLHNDFLDFAVAAGVVGIVVLTTILAAPVAGALAGPRGDRLWHGRLYGALLLSIGYLIYGLTDSVIGNDLPTNVYPLLTALLLGAFRARARDPGSDA